MLKISQVLTFQFTFAFFSYSNLIGVSVTFSAVVSKALSFIEVENGRMK